MTKTLKNIVIIFLLIYSISISVYANLKANEARLQKMVADENAVAATEAAAEARKQESLAVNSAEEARKQASLAQLEAQRAEKGRDEAEAQRSLALEALAACR
ncbi:MAG: biopolymer transport protein ExbB/TolQ, partial [Cellvibrionaceae bacterium]